MNECHTTGPQKKFIGLPWIWTNSLSLRFPKPLLCFWPSLAGRDLAGRRAGHLGWGGGSPGRSLLANCPQRLGGGLAGDHAPPTPPYPGTGWKS